MVQSILHFAPGDLIIFGIFNAINIDFDIQSRALGAGVG